MSVSSNAFRGSNVCHRIELSIPPRRSRNNGSRVQPRPARAAAPAPVSPPEPRVVEPVVREAEVEQVQAPELEPEPAAREALSARERAQRREIDLLNRRLDMVRALLEEREDELRGLLAVKAVDPGLASEYREVQGLEDGARHAALKRQLMAAIFEANLVLQAGMD